MPSSPLITIDHLSFGYQSKHPILQDISLTIAAGDYVGVIGPNGSGKTTFIKLILGLLPLQRGTLTLFGQPVGDFRDWAKVGYVPQSGFEGEVSFPATVRELIAAGIPVRSGWGWVGPQQYRYWQQKIEVVADTVGIRHLLERRLGELSGGEEQRAFIAQALISDPELLVLDEPTAGIDRAAEESFYALLDRLNIQHQKTIILVSHDLEALAHHATSAICLNRTLVYQGPADGLHEARVITAVFGPQAWHLHS